MSDYSALLRAIQGLSGGYGKYDASAANKLNEANFQVEGASTDASFRSSDVDKEIQDIRDQLRTLTAEGEQQNRDLIQQLKARLQSLEQEKGQLDQVGKAADENFWNYRPAGWTGGVG